MTLDEKIERLRSEVDAELRKELCTLSANLRREKNAGAVIDRLGKLTLILMRLIYEAHGLQRPSENLFACIKRAGGGFVASNRKDSIEGLRLLPRTIEDDLDNIRKWVNPEGHDDRSVPPPTLNAAANKVEMFLNALEWFYCTCEQRQEKLKTIYRVTRGKLAARQRAMETHGSGDQIAAIREQLFESVMSYAKPAGRWKGLSGIEALLLQSLARAYPKPVNWNRLLSKIKSYHAARGEVGLTQPRELLAALRSKLQSAKQQEAHLQMDPRPPFLLRLAQPDKTGACRLLFTANPAGTQSVALPPFDERATPLQVWGFTKWSACGPAEESRTRELAIRILEEAAPDSSLDITVHLLPGEWHVPATLEAFHLQRIEWLRSQGKRNEFVSHYVGHEMIDEPRVEITCQKALYSTYWTTNRALQETPIPTSSQTVEDILREEGYGLGHFAYPQATNPLAVNLLVVTTENQKQYAVASRQSPSHAVSAGRWATSLSETLNPEKHVEIARGFRRIDLWELTRMETFNEIGLDGADFDKGRLLWVAFAVGLNTGHFAIMGELQISIPRDELRWNCENRAGKEVDRVDFVEISPTCVSDYLATHDCVPFLELHLALALKRRGLANIWVPEPPLSAVETLRSSPNPT